MAYMNRRSPTGHSFGRPPLQAADSAIVTHSFTGSQAFQPLPPAVGAYPYRLSLSSVTGDAAAAAMLEAGSMTFHIMGDTGGIAQPADQQIVAQKLDADVEQPAFLYLLGDCIYYNGELSQYPPQFYEPYAHYPAPIFAVPGNHDGDPVPGASTLDGFLANFCTTSPQVPGQAQSTGRTTMTQPNVYWTLVAPFVTMIGLYTNVPQGGQLDDTQISWLESELAAADQNSAVILTMHHPPISCDSFHGGSAYMFDLLDQASGRAGRTPDLVLAGHVHDYQRFTRTATVSGQARQVPYIVAGSGGYWHLHTMAADAKAAALPWVLPGHADTQLEAWVDDRHGYMRVTATPRQVSAEFFTVPRSQESWSGAPVLADSFTLDRATHTVGPMA
jgi:calcineurin-like phosphoesterase family protein